MAEPHGWFDKIEYLYNNSEKKEKIAKSARKYVLRNYYGKDYMKEVEEAYDFFAK